MKDQFDPSWQFLAPLNVGEIFAIFTVKAQVDWNQEVVE